MRHKRLPCGACRFGTNLYRANPNFQAIGSVQASCSLSSYRAAGRVYRTNRLDVGLGPLGAFVTLQGLEAVQTMNSWCTNCFEQPPAWPLFFETSLCLLQALSDQWLRSCERQRLPFVASESIGDTKRTRIS
jgi:hypothetical protein